MEQQLEDHMRLPPPVTITGADSTALHKPSHQQLQMQMQMQPAQQARSLSISALTPPFATNTTNTTNTSALYGNGNGNGSLRQPLSSSSTSSLSPRPFGPVPAYSPPSYAFSQQHNHDPSTLHFPDPPSTELAPLQLHVHDHSVSSLPSLASLTRASTSSSRRFAPSSATSDPSYSPPQRPRAWPTGNPYSAYYTGGHGHSADSPARMDIDSMSNGTRGPLSPDTLNGRASSVSLDDPDVRMAAEALGDLKAGEFYGRRHPPPNMVISLSTSSRLFPA